MARGKTKIFGFSWVMFWSVAAALVATPLLIIPFASKLMDKVQNRPQGQNRNPKQKRPKG